MDFAGNCETGTLLQKKARFDIFVGMSPKNSALPNLQEGLKLFSVA